MIRLIGCSKLPYSRCELSQALDKEGGLGEGLVTVPCNTFNEIFAIACHSVWEEILYIHIYAFFIQTSVP